MYTSQTAGDAADDRLIVRRAEITVPIGIPELLILGTLLAIVSPLFVIPYMVFRLRRRAKHLGYTSVRAYLRAAPGTDAEKRDAADLALIGLTLSLLGLIVAPLVLIGIVPLFYGGRKLVYASLGLGLVDDADQPAR
ncbi:MAG: hypothetical protein ABI051_03485 [Vicinamibacterales bacterium]